MTNTVFNTERSTELKIVKVSPSSFIAKGDLGILDDPYYFEAKAWLDVIFETPEGFKLKIKVEEEKLSGGRSIVDKFINECFNKWKTKWQEGFEIPHNYMKIELSFNLPDPSNFF